MKLTDRDLLSVRVFFSYYVDGEQFRSIESIEQPRSRRFPGGVAGVRFFNSNFWPTAGDRDCEGKYGKRKQDGVGRVCVCASARARLLSSPHHGA